LGVPDDIGRVQGIPAVRKVKNHWFKRSTDQSPQMVSPVGKRSGNTCPRKVLRRMAAIRRMCPSNDRDHIKASGKTPCEHFQLIVYLNEKSNNCNINRSLYRNILRSIKAI